MRRSWLTFLFLFPLLAVFTACQDNSTETIHGNGDFRSEARIVGAAHAVSLNGLKADLVVTQSSNVSLRIEADENLLPLISSTVGNGRLTIEPVRDRLHLEPSAQMQIQVSLPGVNDIDLAGIGDASASAIHGERLHVSLSGVGSIVLSDLAVTRFTVDSAGVGSVHAAGTATHQDVNISGTGSYIAQDLPGGDATLTISGAGNAVVRVSDALRVTLSGSSSIMYYGNPQIEQHVSGVGTLVRLGD